jgi:hypothetical protein
MGRKANRPEIIVHRVFKNEVSMVDAFADAYRAYFEEIKMKSSSHTFDRSELVTYNEATNKNTEVFQNGSTA